VTLKLLASTEAAEIEPNKGGLCTLVVTEILLDSDGTWSARVECCNVDVFFLLFCVKMEFDQIKF